MDIVSRENSERRRHRRERVLRRGVLIDGASARSATCVIIDISFGGAQLEILGPRLSDEALSLLDPSSGLSHELNIVWRRGPLIGVAFTSSEK